MREATSTGLTGVACQYACYGGQRHTYIPPNYVRLRIYSACFFTANVNADELMFAATRHVTVLLKPNKIKGYEEIAKTILTTLIPMDDVSLNI
jgi:hypothetical protein